ncbi:MAG: TerB family tellurite resistance protein [Pseudomonadota bacterium]
MHVIIGFLGSVVTILWLLHRLAEMGIDLGGLNPWLWARRRRWRKAYEANPIFAIDSPMDAAALLVTAAAKSDGDMSSEEKQAVLRLFMRTFELSERDATALLTASVHLFGNGEQVAKQLRQVLAPSVTKFSDKQSGDTLAMMGEIAMIGGAASQTQLDLIRNAEVVFAEKATPVKAWS